MPLHGTRLGTILRRWFCLGLLLCAPAWSEERLTVSLATADYPPLIDLRQPNGGLLTQIVVEAFRLSNVEVRLERMPNNRAITGVVRGTYEGSYGWAYNAERGSKLRYSKRPIHANRMVFFQRRGQQFPWVRLVDLAPFLIGVTLGNHYSDEFARLQEAGALRVQQAASDAINIKKLVLGRIDLFPMEEEAGRFLVAQELTPVEQSKIVAQSVAFDTVPVYLVIRRSHPLAQVLIDRFDRGFRQLSDSGQLQRILEQAKRTSGASYPVEGGFPP